MILKTITLMKLSLKRTEDIKMNILQQILLCLGGWVTIIFITNISKKKIDSFSYSEMVKDANNLFSTSITYLLASIICSFLKIIWLKWIICIALIVLAVIPFFSSLILLISRVAKFPHKMTALISQIIPLIIAINIYFMYIR